MIVECLNLAPKSLMPPRSRSCGSSSLDRNNRLQKRVPVSRINLQTTTDLSEAFAHADQAQPVRHRTWSEGSSFHAPPKILHGEQDPSALDSLSGQTDQCRGTSRMARDIGQRLLNDPEDHDFGILG